MQPKRPKFPSGRVKLLAVPLVAALVAVVVALASDGDGGEGGAQPASTSTTKLSGTPTPTSGGDGDSSSTTGTSSPGSTSTTGAATAPWRGPALERSAVPKEFVEAWSRARNRSTCALLVPAGAGPELEGGTASFDVTADDAGWDIYLRRGGRILEILGLFTKESQAEAKRSAPFSKSWSDGSTAAYGADTPGGPFGTPTDPEATAFEALLTLPDQDCAYRIYDTLGKSHLELVLDNLRFVEDAP